MTPGFEEAEPALLAAHSLGGVAEIVAARARLRSGPDSALFADRPGERLLLLLCAHLLHHAVV